MQYASQAYTSVLKTSEIRISIGRRGNPYDNAQAERFIKTLKYEEVYLFEYRDFSEGYTRIGHFLEEEYNRKRLHSALGYLPPVEFEQFHAVWNGGREVVLKAIWAVGSALAWRGVGAAG